MKTEIRVPKQKRSVETKNRIIKAAYELFNTKGYYNTNTAEIAKLASSATGTVYSYFIDKHDIFFYVIDLYMDMITDRIKNFKNEMPSKNMNEIIEFYIYSLIEIHLSSKKFHNELHAQCLVNEDIYDYYNEKKSMILSMIEEDLISQKIVKKSLRNKEQIFIISEIVDTVSHQYVYNNKSLNRKALIKESIREIIKILK